MSVLHNMSCGQRKREQTCRVESHFIFLQNFIQTVRKLLKINIREDVVYSVVLKQLLLNT